MQIYPRRHGLCYKLRHAPGNSLVRKDFPFQPRAQNKCILLHQLLLFARVVPITLCMLGYHELRFNANILVSANIHLISGCCNRHNGCCYVNCNAGKCLFHISHGENCTFKAGRPQCGTGSEMTAHGSPSCAASFRVGGGQTASRRLCLPQTSLICQTTRSWIFTVSHRENLVNGNLSSVRHANIGGPLPAACMSLLKRRYSWSWILTVRIFALYRL